MLDVLQHPRSHPAGFLVAHSWGAEQEGYLVLLEWRQRGLAGVRCWGRPERVQMGLAQPDCCGAVPYPALTPAPQKSVHRSQYVWYV